MTLLRKRATFEERTGYSKISIDLKVVAWLFAMEEAVDEIGQIWIPQKGEEVSPRSRELSNTINGCYMRIADNFECILERNLRVGVMKRVKELWNEFRLIVRDSGIYEHDLNYDSINKEKVRHLTRKVSSNEKFVKFNG